MGVASVATVPAVRLLVTGGTGFIGANLAIGLAARHPAWHIVAVDNLSRRGGELNLPRLREAGVSFRHGDVRMLDDLLSIGELDALVDDLAERETWACGPTGMLDALEQHWNDSGMPISWIAA